MNKQDANKVLMVGDSYLDIIFGKLPQVPQPGREVYSQTLRISAGGVFNTASALRLLGMDVLLATHIGTDYASKIIAEEYKEIGIDDSLFLWHDKPSPFVTASFSIGNDRAMISHAPEWIDKRFGPEILTGTNANFLYIPWIDTAANSIDLMKNAKERGLTTLVDCQDSALTIKHEQVQQALSLADYFLPNLQEAIRLTGTQNIEQAAKVLLEYTNCAIVKMGENGASAFCRNRKPVHIKAYPARVADTTGAGDNFNAGFLLGLSLRLDVADAMQIGAVCGALAVSQLGGASVLPGREEVLNKWRSYYAKG